MEKSALEAAIADGLSVSQLADRFGYASVGPVNYWLRKHGLKTKFAQNPRLRWRFSEQELTTAVVNSTSMSGVCRYLGVNISSHGHVSKRVKDLGLDTSHFQSMPEGFRSRSRRTAENILVVLPSDARRTQHVLLNRALQDIGVEYKCEGCGNTGEWLGVSLSLEIDHIDGNWRNNLRENLRYLCPNCHGITPTHSNRKRS